MDSDLATDSLEGRTKGLFISCTSPLRFSLDEVLGADAGCKEWLAPTALDSSAGKALKHRGRILHDQVQHSSVRALVFLQIIQRALHPKKSFESILLVSGQSVHALPARAQVRSSDF